MSFKKNNLGAFIDGFSKAGGGLKGAVSGIEAFISSFGKAKLALGGFAIAAMVIGPIISDIATSSERMKESAKDLGSELVSDSQDLDGYKDKILELQGVISDSSSSIDEVVEARQELIGIQDALIEKYGSEADTINIVTDAINGQVDALNELSRANYYKKKNEFNEKSAGETFLDFLTYGNANDERVRSNMDVMYDQMRYGNYELKSTGNERVDELISEAFGFYQRDDGTFAITGSIEEIKEKLYDIQKITSSFEVSTAFENSFTEISNDVDSLITSYSDLYNQHVLWEKVLSENPENQYDDHYNLISQAKDNYDEALKRGSVEDQDAAFNVYAEALSSAISFAEGNYDYAVSDFFEDMYPALSQQFASWNFKLDIEANEDGLKDSVETAINGLSGFSIEDIAEFNLNTALDGQVESYTTLLGLTEQYEISIEQLLALLSEMGYVQSERYLELVSLFGEENVATLLPEDLTYAYTIENKGELTFEEFVEKIKSAKEEASKDYTEDISFVSLLKSKEKSPETLAEYVDKYKTELSSIQTILDNIKSGEYTLLDSAEMIGSVPELAGHTNSLEEIKKTLNDLSYDKLAEFVDGYQTYISKLTDPAEIEAAREYMNAIINTVTLDGIDFDYNAFYSSLADGIDNLGWSRQGVATKTIQQVWDEFGGTEDGREILATLSLNPDAASWTYEQWAENIENKEVYIKLKLREEERKLLESQISDIQAKGDLIDARNSAKEESGYRLTREDYEASVSNKEAEIAKRQSERAISINERSELDRNAENYASEKARLDAEITQATLEIFNLRQEINGLNEDIENIPKVEIEGRIELKELEADGLKAQIDKLEEEGKVIPKSLRQYYMSSQSDLVAYNTILENILQNQIDTFEGDKTSDAYIGLVSALQAVQEASANATKEVDAQWKVMENSPLTILSKELSDLEAQASELEDTLSFKESAGLKVVASDYEKLVSNSKLQVVNLVNTNKELNDEMDAFIASNGDINSEEYKDLEQQVIANESAIRSATLSQIEWNKTIQNLPITQIQELSSAISTALTETNEATGVSIETMDTIRMQFSDIEDMDVEDLFYSTADGVKISTKKLKDFAKAENKIVRARFDKEIEDQKDAIEDYQNEIGAGKVDSKLRDLQNNLEGIMDRQAAYFAQYQEQMESISKYAEIEIAENTPNQGAKYDAMQKRLESWKEMYDKGLWGTDDFQSMGEYFNAYGFGDSESFMGDYKRASRYITEDASGVRTFFDDLEKKGLATYQTLEDGSETLVLDFKDAADAALTMGMGEEFFLDMFGKAEEYGASAVLIDSLTDSALQTNELNQELYEAQKRLIELKAAGADASAIEKQEGIVAGIKDELKTVEEVTDNYIANQDEKFAQGFMGLKDLYSEYQKYYIEAMGKGDTATAEKWLDDMQNLLDEYGFEIDLSAEGIDPRRFKIDDVWQNQFEKMTVGKMGSWENQLDPDTLGVSAENIEAFKDVRSTLSKAYKENKDGLRENLEILKKYDAETLKSIDLADGAYGEYADAEKALDALAKTLGITDPQKLQMMAYALEGVGNVAPKLQPIVDSLEEMRETGDIQITTEIDADLSLLTLEELEKRSEELEGLKIQFENDPEMLETINILQTQTDIERGVRFVQEEGYSIEDLVGLSDQEVMEIAAQIGIDESELRSAIDQIESQEIGMTVKIAESQFQQLTNPNPINAEAANAEIDSIKENIATLPETAEENAADVNVNTISAVKDINGVDKLLDKLDSTTAKPRVDVLGVDTAISRINSLVMQLNKLANKQITVRTSVNSTGSNANHSGEITAAPAADGTLYGAYADGTAYNMLNLRAYAGGTNVGLKHDETALVNEEGTEGLIRDGILYEIPGGMHTQALKKGDIILSVQQMQQLKETGKASGHGKRYGSAYADGTLHGTPAYTAGNIKLPNSLTISPKYEGSLEQAADNLGKALNSSTGTTKKSLDDIIDALNNVKDWIEVLCNRLQEDIDYKLAQSDNAVSYGDKNSLVSNAQTTTQALIEANTAGAAEYGAYADKVAKDVGLSKKLKKKVQNGTIEIEKLSEDDQKRVQAYEEWYQKQRDCLQAAEELKASLRELAQQKFDNIATEFDNMLGVIEHTGNLLNISMEKQELKGHITSAKYYQALINNTKDSRVKLVEKQKELETSLKESMDAGIIKEGSVEWYEMQGEINGVIEEIKEADNQIIQFQNDIRETKWAMQDMAHENVNRLTSESDFLIDLMSSDKLFDDRGNITNQGMATTGLNMMNYNTALSEAQTYEKEWREVQAQIDALAANGDDYDINLINRANDLRDKWMDASSAANQYAQAIKDLKDQEFQAQLDSLQKLSDKYMEVLNKQKDMYDYQTEISDLTSEKSRLEKLQIAYSNDTSEEGRLKRQQVENDLEKIDKQIEETQYDKYISDQQEILDSVYTKTEEFFQQRLDNVDQLLEEATFNANANKDQILDTLKAEGAAVACDLTTEMESIWGKDGSVLTTFTDDFADKSASTLAILGTIRNGVVKMAQISDVEAESGANGAGGNTDPNYDPNKTVENTNVSGSGGKPDANKNSGGGNGGQEEDPVNQYIREILDLGVSDKSSIKKAKKKKHSDLWNYIVDNYGHIPTNMIYKQLGRVMGIPSDNGFTKKADKNKLLKALKARGFRKGTDYLNKDRWTMTQEDGREIIALPDGSILAPFKKGTGVINNAKTEQILSLANNHDAIMEMTRTASLLMDWQRASEAAAAEAQLLKSQIINNNAGNEAMSITGTTININLPGVQKPEDFMNWLRNNTRAQHDLQDVVFSEVMGRGKLSTRKK